MPIDSEKIHERLASLEAKLGFLKELLQEIRVDIKDQPSRVEFNELKDKHEALEKKVNSIFVKVGVLSSTLGMIAGAIIKYFIG